MNDYKTHTAEMVTLCHPDKICDQVADAIVDKCLAQDPLSRVAVEVLGGHGYIFLVGEITTRAEVDYEQVAEDVYFDLTGKSIKVTSRIVKQSPNIAMGVDTGGAGDQGIMVGYACDENEARMPDELQLVREILLPFKVDGKSQITITDGKISHIVLSVQGKTQKELFDYVIEFLDKQKRTGDLINRYDIFCNNTGSFDIGGFDADTGCTGRKIVIDQYGTRVPVGGGAFSGKDPTKVDRSGAYMARFIALDLLKQKAVHEVTVKLAYVIGRAEPVMATANFGNGTQIDISKFYDCRPQAIVERFELRRPIYQDLARNGHFGRKELMWEGGEQK